MNLEGSRTIHYRQAAVKIYIVTGHQELHSLDRYHQTSLLRQANLRISPLNHILESLET